MQKQTEGPEPVPESPPATATVLPSLGRVAQTTKAILRTFLALYP